MKGRTRKLVESRLFWKYAVIILALVILSIYLIVGFNGSFSAQNLVNGIFYSVVTSLVVSLFYDVSTRRDLIILVEEERQDAERKLGETFLSRVALSTLPDNEADRLAGQVAESDRMMEKVALSLLGEQGRSFFYTWLKPLVDRRLLQSASIENRLSRAPGRQDAYVMEYRQTFKASESKALYFIVFTCDNDLYNNLITSGLAVDELVGTSTEEWSDIDQQVSSLAFSAYRNRTGLRETLSITASPVSSDDLARRIQRPVSSTLVRAFEFRLQADVSWTYEYSYKVRNRLSDPYYYWTAVNPMFVNKLIIDYRELKPLIGRVSANCILGSASCDPQHDADVGVYTVNIDSLVWPGQGAIVIWRPSSVGLDS